MSNVNFKIILSLVLIQSILLVKSEIPPKRKFNASFATNPDILKLIRNLAMTDDNLYDDAAVEKAAMELRRQLDKRNKDTSNERKNIYILILEAFETLRRERKKLWSTTIRPGGRQTPRSTEADTVRSSPPSEESSTPVYVSPAPVVSETPEAPPEEGGNEGPDEESMIADTYVNKPKVGLPEVRGGVEDDEKKLYWLYLVTVTLPVFLGLLLLILLLCCCLRPAGCCCALFDEDEEVLLAVAREQAVAAACPGLARTCPGLI